MSGEEIFDDAEDSLLLMTRQSAEFLEHAAGFANGAAFLILWLDFERSLF
jgi:hypothetical protein